MIHKVMQEFGDGTLCPARLIVLCIITRKDKHFEKTDDP